MESVRGWASAIDSGLRQRGNPERAVQEKRYLKSELAHVGASVPAIRRISEHFVKTHPALDRAGLLLLVEALWGTGVHEHRMAAAEVLDFRSDLLELQDSELLERLLRESKTWALVDNLSARVAGALAERFPGFGEVLDGWAAEPDFWLRRSAFLALLLPLRRGEGDIERFSRYADAMLGEREFFVRKAISWVLREVGKRRPQLVIEWLLPRVSRASGLTLREALRHLPAERQRALLDAGVSGSGGGGGGRRGSPSRSRRSGS